ncbi:4'-phosphopantetheinyl transferase family protein [Altericroceibacterium xinjiangense]|uniref:4'-phosphopantetheinyl transferase family protein n=1 Tax=Altericroceibacterium xinjiangense TaxID=762261 RepID=UPI0013DEE65B|nr:4'-phosphopantetheinyl transferase superfamily protein [Altericroceibacterium xinjiangense]
MAARPLPAPFPVWLISVPDQPRQELSRLLSASERARADRFRTSDLRHRYWAAHGALRLLGECYFGIPAIRQSYVPNRYGKLQLIDVEAAQCSISYTGQQVLVAWSQGAAIGIDAELVRPIGETRDLMQLHCTQREQAFLERSAKDSAKLDRMFLTLWVRKEACVKALGRGLTISPSSFDCGIERATTVEIEGCSVDNEVMEVGEDILVAWARCRHDLTAPPRPFGRYP